MFLGCMHRAKNLQSAPNQVVYDISFEEIDLNKDGNISSSEFLLLKKEDKNDFLSPAIVFVSISIIILILLYFSRRSMEK